MDKLELNKIIVSKLNPARPEPSDIYYINSEFSNLKSLIDWHVKKCDYLLEFIFSLSDFSRDDMKSILSEVDKRDYYRSIGFIKISKKSLDLVLERSDEENLNEIKDAANNIILSLYLDILPNLELNNINLLIELESNYAPYKFNNGISLSNNSIFSLTKKGNNFTFSQSGNEIFSVDKKSRTIEAHSSRSRVYDRAYIFNKIELVHFKENNIHAMSQKIGDENPDVSIHDIRKNIESSLSLIHALYGSEAVKNIVNFNRTLIYSSPKERGWFNSSSSHQYSFSCFLTTYPDTPLKTAESIIHETMHILLGFSFELDKLYENPDNEHKYSHPWMDIPRPMRGVFLGAHAFTNVCDLYRKVCLDEEILRLQPWVLELFKTRVSEVGTALKEIESKAILTESGLKLYKALHSLWLKAKQMDERTNWQVKC